MRAHINFQTRSSAFTIYGSNFKLCPILIGLESFCSICKVLYMFNLHMLYLEENYYIPF